MILGPKPGPFLSAPCLVDISTGCPAIVDLASLNPVVPHVQSLIRCYPFGLTLSLYRILFSFQQAVTTVVEISQATHGGGPPCTLARLGLFSHTASQLV